MKKAFIFDLDGVLINNEPAWEKTKKEMFAKLLGSEAAAHMGSTVGSNIHVIHKMLTELGATISKEDLHAGFQQYARKIYSETPITPGIEALGKELIAQEYALGAIKTLEATPSTTIILEDSNTGIASGKAAGAYVIGLRQNLIEGYIQECADTYVDTVEEVITIVKNFFQK